ncbi:glycoside hydrolase family 43 protein [Enterococcus mundtii]|uniref:glycoside hydrolase family 43 protein n=1 Tax=Enterococcus mundtii TaxID=53346 RepID=UPI001CF5EFF2|nr:glycoside hydrolase family 43 protein [Enterococcus mundtii]MCA6773629.1 glycoside hydrolase family 43 protein [Enterococcus mundtii]
MGKSVAWLSSVSVLFAALVITGCGAGTDTGEEVSDFTSIIDNDGADPWILQTESYFYYTKTTENNLTLWRAENLSLVATGEKKIIWEIPEEFESIWAPELHYLDDRWVMYFAANHPSETHRMYALVNHQKDPYMGEWQLEEIKGMDDKFAIDGTVLEINDKRYFLWSGWEGYENIAQNLYLAEMVSPTKVVGEKRLISKPEYEWEMRQTPLINEAPQVITKDKTVNLVYSASGSWDNDYALGLMTLDVADDPLEKANWQKEPEPIFQQTNTVYGPGHNGFAKSKDGSEDWLIYHAARWDHSGWDRSIRLQKFGWDQEDKVLLEAPLDEWHVQALPKAEPNRLRLTASRALLEGDLALVEDEEALSKKVVQGFESTTDKIIFTPQIEESDEFLVIAYVKTTDYLSLNDPIQVKIETKQASHVVDVYPSEYYQPLQVRMKLPKGSQEITLSSEIGVDTLSTDRLEIVK